VTCILIVDDSPLIRRSLRTSLEQGGWMLCEESENGRDGIVKAQQLHPDLIVLDLVMPVMSGLEAARELKHLMPTIPLVMFTTFSNPFLNKEALTVGIRAVIDKSGGAAPLINCIQQLLGDSAAKPPS
jgi:DNA-binding NarL/FixJ family response regulator